jgi:hypothetical protein
MIGGGFPPFYQLFSALSLEKPKFDLPLLVVYTKIQHFKKCRFYRHLSIAVKKAVQQPEAVISSLTANYSLN